ncbi:lysozyme [Escherichia coli PA40]|nr:lysozyme [Escherichia coli PA40]
MQVIEKVPAKLFAGGVKDGGRDCRIRSNNCYGQVSRRDQESALACWGIDR